MLHVAAIRERWVHDDAVVLSADVHEVRTDDVVALGLQQLAAFTRQFHHVWVVTGFADAVGDVPHAGGRLQNGHAVLYVGRLDHVVGHVRRRREEVETILAPADHGALHFLHLVRCRRCLARQDELAQRRPELCRRLDAHSRKAFAFLVYRLEDVRNRQFTSSRLLHDLGAEIRRQRDAFVGVSIPCAFALCLGRTH